MKIYFAGGTGKSTGRMILNKKGHRLFSYYDLVCCDRSYYSGYEIEWYIGEKCIGTKRKEVKRENLSGNMARR
jgi:hypothetical protein